MAKKEDKYTALWLSHSSLGDYLKCPRLYYLHNIWKNEWGRKVNIVSPHMSLGLAVHQVIEPLAKLPAEKRFEHDLLKEYENVWEKFSGAKGGFADSAMEAEFKERGKKMVENVIKNKGPLAKKTIKYYTGDFIPNIYLSEEDNIILCGLVDWVEYLEDDTLRVIDFKTGKKEESEDSMQLPIYKILVEALQKRKVSSCAYWYLDKDSTPKEIILEDEEVEDIKKKILEVGKIMKSKKNASKKESEFLENFSCAYKDINGESCRFCNDFMLIKNNDKSVIYLGTGEYKQDLYYIKT